MFGFVPRLSVLFAAVLLILTTTTCVGGDEDTAVQGTPTGCSMANLHLATSDHPHRFAYGLTVDCIFFYFDISEYGTMDKALNYLVSQWSLYRDKNPTLCPPDLFSIRFVSGGDIEKPFFEVVNGRGAISQQVFPIKGKRFGFDHITGSVAPSWSLSPSGWGSYHQGIVVHTSITSNRLTGIMDVSTYVRPISKRTGYCVHQTFGTYPYFQLNLVLGESAEAFEDFMNDVVAKPEPPITLPVSLIGTYFNVVVAVTIIAILALIVFTVLLIWQICKYRRFEARRHEIEHFLVTCYVEKLNRLTHRKPHKKTTTTEQTGVAEPKKKKKKSSSSCSHSHHHHHHHCVGAPAKSAVVKSSTKKPTRGSKVIPLPNEKELFVSDRKKKSEPRATPPQPQPPTQPPQMPVKPEDPKPPLTVSRGRNSDTSVCSLRSLTDSINNSTDWTGKGVRLSRRAQAIQMYKEDLSRDEDEAFKLGVNVSTLRRKRQREQRGQALSEKSKAKAVGPAPAPGTAVSKMDLELRDRMERERQKRLLEHFENKTGDKKAANENPVPPATSPLTPTSTPKSQNKGSPAKSVSLYPKK